MSQSFELRIIEDGTHSSDHSCLIGLRFDMAGEQKPLPEEPKEQGFYVTANDGRLLLKDIGDDWSARTYDNSADPIWNGNRQYVKWPTVCETLPPEAFPFERVNTGADDDD